MVLVFAILKLEESAILFYLHVTAYNNNNNLPP